MPVQVSPLINGDTPAQRQEAARSKTQHIPIGIVLVVLGALWWLPAARTTVDGWVVILNTMLDFFAITETIPRASGWLLFGLALAVGGLYSTVETKFIPVRMVGGVLRFSAFSVLLGWLFLSTTDVATTFAGIMSPPVDAWAIHKQLASNAGGAGVVALVSTFAPDWVIIIGTKMIIGKSEK